MASLTATWDGLRQCRLCWRVAACVFVTILAVEAVILVVSVQQFERERLNEAEREALVLTRAVLRVSADRIGWADPAAVGNTIRRNTVLSGLTIWTESGQELGQFGDPPTVSMADFPEDGHTVRSVDDAFSHMDVVWSPARTRTAFPVAARIDIAHVPGQVNSYIWRIVGLVLLISLATTMIAMFVLERVVLRPLRALNTGLSEVASNPTGVRRIRLSMTGTDELADAARNFDLLNARLSESLNRIADQNDRLVDVARIEEANRAQSEFLANMSHDLRTPLNAVIGFSSLMADRAFGPLGDGRYDGYARAIQDSGRQLLDIVDDLLDLGRIEAGRYNLKEKWIDPIATIHAARTRCAMAHGVDQDRIELDLSDGPHRLNADRKALDRILDNLIGNGLLHAGPNATIWIRWRDSDDGGELRIADNGIGIPSDQVSQLTDAFQQGGADFGRRALDSRAAKGLGLGLAITVKLAALHGARMTLSSDTGQGVDCRIVFPAWRSEQPDMAQAG